MLVSRPLSMYRKSPSKMSVAASEAPYSGYLVIKDEEAAAEDSYCCGICSRKSVKKLPLPTDRILTLLHTTSQYQQTKSTKLWFLPVLDRPLSSNRYYLIKAQGKHKGKAYRCAREDDITTCCFGDAVSDKTPRPLNLRDIYQQFHIHRHHAGGFIAHAVAPDGIPPKFLRSNGWKLRSSSPIPLPHHSLTQFLGLHPSVRSLLPDFNFPIFTARSQSTVVGKWYCPFLFVREKPSLRLRTQMKSSPIYSLTLEQCWEEIFSCENATSESSSVVTVAIDVAREVPMVGGREAVREERENGYVWFRVAEELGVGVGLSVGVVEKMRWVQEAGGWYGGGGERVVRVEREEEVRSESGWRRFSVYVLVESFVLRRTNGSLVWKCNFRHTHNIRCKWE